jgi:hypothetical protein
VDGSDVFRWVSAPVFGAFGREEDIGFGADAFG